MADTYGIGEKTYVAVIDMPSVTEKATFDRKYTGIARFPAVTRDLSMVVPKNILAGQIEDMIRVRGGKILESCTLFDIYEGRRSRKALSPWLTPLYSAPRIRPWKRRRLPLP